MPSAVVKAMEELFITKIHIQEVRHLKDFDIPLSETERKHLILTGRNGSGKTSVLEAVERVFVRLREDKKGGAFHILDQLIAKTVSFGPPNVDSEIFDSIAGNEVRLSFNHSWEEVATRSGELEFQLIYFAARRRPEYETPTVIEKVTDFKGSNLLKYLLNITADRAFALEEKDPKSAQKTDEWLENFKQILRELFGDPKLEFDFNRKDYHYYLKQEGKNPVHFNQLPDGFAAIIEILSELIMRIEKVGEKATDIQGIVLIDEIETHLHIELQKRVFPFLTQLFPRIQFIVTTHSPFVLGSVDNAVICDLEKHIVTEDLSGYSSEMIVESYFGMDKYSDLLKKQVDEYELLMAKEEPTLEDEDRMEELAGYFETLPKYLADELTVKLQQIRLKRLKPQR